MMPRVTVRHRAAGDADYRGLLRYLPSVPSEHRFRVSLEAVGDFAGLVRAVYSARRLGFRRVRVEFTGGMRVGEEDFLRLLRAGANEVAFDCQSAPKPEVVKGALKGLAHVVLLVEGTEDWGGDNPWGAHEIEVRVRGRLRDVLWKVGRLMRAAQGFRFVGVRGVPLCQVEGLDAGRVISNCVEVFSPEGVLWAKSWDPKRVFFATCRNCTLFLACDGFSIEDFLCGQNEAVLVRAFGAGEEVVRLGVGALVRRDQPLTFFAGRFPLWAVAAGVRPAGRFALGKSDLEGQIQAIVEEGLQYEVLEEVPADQDGGDQEAVHVFFAREADLARRAAEIERDFVRSQRAKRSVGAEEFAWDMGLALGYPECCIEAFVRTGARATTQEHLRRALLESAEAHWCLNCTEPKNPFVLVPHLPCRLDCSWSTDMASRVLACVNEKFPGLAGAAEEVLKRPVVGLRGLGVVVFSGTTASPNEVIYDSVARWHGRFEPHFLEALMLGQRLRVLGDAIEVYDSSGSPKRFAMEEAILFPFR